MCTCAQKLIEHLTQNDARQLNLMHEKLNRVHMSQRNLPLR